MRTPSLLADFIHARDCKPFCEKLLTLPPLRTPSLLADFIHARDCKPFCEKLLTLPEDGGSRRPRIINESVMDFCGNFIYLL